MRKIYLFIVFIAILTLAACTTEPTPTQPIDTEPVESQPVETELPTMTLAELSQYDGKNGAKAYVAISGNIYDVTSSVYWPNGSHNGYQAGQDLTQPLLNLSPHGITNILRFPVVAKLADGE
jgi:predicted heme/steroid binding protein